MVSKQGNNRAVGLPIRFKALIQIRPTFSQQELAICLLITDQAQWVQHTKTSHSMWITELNSIPTSQVPLDWILRLSKDRKTHNQQEDRGFVQTLSIIKTLARQTLWPTGLAWRIVRIKRSQTEECLTDRWVWRPQLLLLTLTPTKTSTLAI
jgi:hypothetical protein